MNKTLFNEFEGVSSKAWKQKIQVDLKGADYNDTLIWNTNDGIDVKPFYHSDELSELPEVSLSQATNWMICQHIVVKETIEANKTAKDAIKRGAESLIVEIKNESTDVVELLQGLDTINIPIFIKTRFGI